MEVLSSRILLRSADPERLTAFYRDQLKLAVAREYPGGVVFHAGTGYIEVPAHMSDQVATGGGADAMLWLQVRDAAAATAELRDADVPIVREARTEPWGLIEMHVRDPDDRRIIIVEVPADHPLRRDTR